LILDNDRGPAPPPKPCVRFAIFVAIIHCLTLARMMYQRANIVRFDEFFFINWSAWLAPVVLPLISRKVCPLVALWALPIVTLFVMRMYYISEFHRLGFNAHAGPKALDMALLLTMAFGVLAMVIVCGWLLFCAVVYLSVWIDRWRDQRP
jgi:hypothetical protein